jgi:hypothetical protein
MTGVVLDETHRELACVDCHVGGVDHSARCAECHDDGRTRFGASAP